MLRNESRDHFFFLATLLVCNIANKTASSFGIVPLCSPRSSRNCSIMSASTEDITETKIEEEETMQQSSPSSSSDASSLSWDAFTLEYEARVEPFTSQFALEMIRELFGGDPPMAAKEAQRRKLLDVGCGTGAASLMALDRCDRLEVAVTDKSPSMVRRAESRIVDAASRSSLLAAEACDGEALPGKWIDEFDFAVANFSVIFFPDPAAGLREMRRCLVPGTGRAALAAWGDEGETPAFRIFPRAAAEVCPELAPTSKPRRITGSVQSLAALMEEAGFIDIRVVGPLAKTLEVASPLEYYNRFALTSPPNVKMISKMDDDTKLRFKRRVMDLAKTRGGREDGSVALTSSAYIAYGRKA